MAADGGGRSGHAIGILFAKTSVTGQAIHAFAPRTPGGGSAGHGAPATSKGAKGNCPDPRPASGWSRRVDFLLSASDFNPLARARDNFCL
jgi:hypothetical protein